MTDKPKVDVAEVLKELDALSISCGCSCGMDVKGQKAIIADAKAAVEQLQEEGVAGYKETMRLLGEARIEVRTVKAENTTLKQLINYPNTSDAIHYEMGRKDEATVWQAENTKLKERVAELEGVISSPRTRELLAALCHDQWSGWMEYLFGKCCNKSGALLIPVWAVERWTCQAETKYMNLSAEEKDSDRTEADKFIALLDKALSKKVLCPRCKKQLSKAEQLGAHSCCPPKKDGD